MKLDCDFSDLRDLRMQRAKFAAALAAIDGAIASLESAPTPAAPAFIPPTSATPATDAGSNSESEGFIRISLRNEFPGDFTTPAAIQWGKSHEIHGRDIRDEIRKMVESGELVEVSKGSGRKASVFRFR